MSRYLLKFFLLAAITLISSGILVRPSEAYQLPQVKLLNDIEKQLREATDSEIEIARTQVQHTCATAIRELSKTAYGYVLTHDLKLRELQDLLSVQQPSTAVLKAFEEQLRLITPGKNQAYIDDLQQHLNNFRCTLGTNHENLLVARKAITLLRESQLAKPPFEAQAKLHEAFAALHTVSVNPHLLRELQSSLSTPNVQAQFRIETLNSLGQTTFQIPVESTTCNDRTHIQVQGNIEVKLTPSFRRSASTIPLIMDVHGKGLFNATAHRHPATVQVELNALASGRQPIEIEPWQIVKNRASVQVDLNSRLTDVQLTGHLDRVRLLRNLLGRAIENKLAEQDKTLSETVENEISKRAEEEGYKLAFKINRLLTQSLWARLESVRFTPHIQLATNDSYVESHSLYAYPDQLGALSSPPKIPDTLVDQIDWTTHIHQSAINNILGKLRSFKLDEATLRGVWQVQLKITTPDWETPTVAVVPAQITFADTDPIHVELNNHRLVIRLHLMSALDPSTRKQLSPLRTTFEYSLARDNKPFRILRSAFSIPEELTAPEAAAWNNVLARFFPESLQPIPKFQPSMWENYVALRYLNTESGWLSVGLASLSDQAAKIPVAVSKDAQP